MACIAEQIIENIETLIPTMVEGEGADAGSDGYNYSWPSTINMHDMSKVRGGEPFCDIFIESETPVDENEGLKGDHLVSEISIRIEIGIRRDTQPENPIRECQIDCFKAYDDLKRLFGRNHQLIANGNNGAFDFRRGSRPAEFAFDSNDALNPGRLKTYWTAKYYASRTNPDLRSA